MNHEQGSFSEEFLNAFVDDQLDPEEKARAYTLLSHDEEFNRRVCELRKVRDLVQFAFRDLEGAGVSRRRKAYGPMGQAVFATTLLLVGVLIGWGIRVGFSSRQGLSAFNHIFVAARARSPVTSAGEETKVLFHLDSGKRTRMRQVLDEAQNLLQLYKSEHRPAEVEIIANGNGINLLRLHHSPFAARIRALHQEYPNLRFAACQDTIDRLISEQNVHPHLLPQATVVPSGVAQIIRMQQRGWTYIRV